MAEDSPQTYHYHKRRMSGSEVTRSQMENFCNEQNAIMKRSSSSSRPEEVFTQRRKRGDGKTEKDELVKRWENEAVKQPPLLKLVAVVESAVLSAHRRRRRRVSEGD
nr:hypothetical protein Iba_chr02dCG5380 [Ipomoea batatas]